MKIYLGLGSNQGDRRANLATAIERLRRIGLRRARVSPVVETPALLPSRAPSDWNVPFLNLVLEGEVDATPPQWLEATKAIQHELGRTGGSRWSPRPMDIDLLLWGEERIESETLRIPHPQMHRRAFVLVPLAQLAPSLRIPGGDGSTVLELARGLAQRIPLWMGIVNVTPDSFSDGGAHQIWQSAAPLIEAMASAGAHLIDLGAESTRPGATPIGAEAEWGRLAPVLEPLLERWRDQALAPAVSVDTRHVEVAERAIERGVGLVNDVSGLESPDMIALARDSDVQWVAMHHLTIPADSRARIRDDDDPVAAVDAWFEARIEQWLAAGLDLDRILLDPGIGFGKSSLQSLELLRHVERFTRHGLRILVGHSRKSFMRQFSELPPANRDLITIGASLKLAEHGVDILRVHDVPGHVRAYSGWAHVQGYDA